MDGRLSQKLPVNYYKWVEETLQFKAIMMIMMKNVFLKLMFSIQKIYIIFTMIYPFYLKEQKLKNLYDTEEYVVHIRNLKEALSHRLVLQKVYRVIDA